MEAATVNAHHFLPDAIRNHTCFHKCRLHGDTVCSRLDLGRARNHAAKAERAQRPELARGIEQIAEP
jgi:hypothetical protein